MNTKALLLVCALLATPLLSHAGALDSLGEMAQLAYFIQGFAMLIMVLILVLFIVLAIRIMTRKDEDQPTS